MKPNWPIIKEERIRDKTSYRELGEKYGVKPNTIEKRARNEKWDKTASEIIRRSQEKAIESISTKAAKHMEEVLGQSKEWRREIDKLKVAICGNSSKSMNISTVALAIKRLDDVERRAMGLHDPKPVQIDNVNVTLSSMELQARLLERLQAMQVLKSEGKLDNLSLDFEKIKNAKIIRNI